MIQNLHLCKFYKFNKFCKNMSTDTPHYFLRLGETIRQARLMGEVRLKARKTRPNMSYDTIREAFNSGPNTPGRKLAIEAAQQVLEESGIQLVADSLPMVAKVSQ